MIKSVLQLIERGQRRRWALVFGVASVGALLEVFAGGMVLGLAGLITNDGLIEVPVLGTIAVDVDNRQVMVLGLGLFLVFFLFKALFTVGSRYVQYRIAQGIGVRLARRLFAAYVNAPYAYHLQRNSASLIRTAQTSVDETVSLGFIPLVNIATQSLLAAGLIALLVVTSPMSALLASGVIGVAVWAIQRGVRPRLRTYGKTAHEAVAETLQWLQQALASVRDVIILGREDYFIKRYGRARSRLARARYLRPTVAAVPDTMLEFSIVAVLVLLTGIAVIASDDPASVLPIASLFAYAGLRLKPAVQLIVSSANLIQYGAAAIEAVQGDLAELQNQQRRVERTEPCVLSDRILFESVSFRYDGAASDALSRVDLEIKSGEQVGLCGPTGGGKTTLVDLMAGLIDPTEGRLTIDGRDARDIRNGWQASIGAVSQEVVLIDDTLRRNIALGVADGQVDEVALAEALELAQLGPFINELPNGLETVVGERGVRLSGGQRQRVGIARALYRRPSVLLFDEGTSALDNMTEAHLMQAIESLRGRLTTVIVAHRLNTVRKADRIFFVADGKVAGAGTYDELISTHKGFARLAGGL